MGLHCASLHLGWKTLLPYLCALDIYWQTATFWFGIASSGLSIIIFREAIIKLTLCIVPGQLGCSPLLPRSWLFSHSGCERMPAPWLRRLATFWLENNKENNNKKNEMDQPNKTN